jgi:succinate-acetate transporter protein
MSSKQNFGLILLLAAALLIVFGWISFHPHTASSLSSSPVILAILVLLGVFPAYPLYRTISKRTRFSALGLILLITGVLLGLGYLAANWLLHISTQWLSSLGTVSGLLIAASCLFAIWNGVFGKHSGEARQRN